MDAYLCLDVVVVDVQLRVRVRRAGRVERDLDEARAERVVEDVRPPGTVVVERLVDDIPGVCAGAISSPPGKA